MTIATFLYLLLWVFSAQSAISNNEGGPLIRAIRSPHCSECEGRGPPQPPPPPPGGPPHPVFHTHQWTGVQRTDDGINGVFSGAAAAADNGIQMAGRAFSLASSSLDGSAGATSGAAVGAAAGAGLKTDVGADGGQYAVGLNAGIDGAGAGFGTGVGANSGAQSAQSSFGRTGYGGQSSGGYNGRADGSNGYGNNIGNSDNFGSGHGFKSFRESHYHYSDNKRFGDQAEQSQGGDQYGHHRDVEQIQSGGFGDQSNAKSQSSSYGSERGSGSSGYDSGFSQRGHGQYGKLSSGNQFSNEGQIQPGSAGNGRGEGSEQQLQTSGGGQWETGSSAGATQQANEDTQTALNGAFGLAAQGVQASQQAQPGGCSTCGKSNYALSNAKSHSGNAVAVSVGG